MKQTSIIATLLTLLSLLLVAGAAVVFLLQGRQELRTDILLLESEIEGQNQMMAQIQTTAAAREMALSTSQALLSTSEIQRATSEALVATRENELAQSQQALDDLAATHEAVLQAQSVDPPWIDIVSPESDDVVDAETSLEIEVIASHRQGLQDLRLEVGPHAITFQGNGDTFRLFPHTTSPLEPGALTITATVTAANEQTASDVVSITVRPRPDEDEQDAQSRWLLLPVAALPR